MKKTILGVALLLMALMVYPRVFSFVYCWVPPKFWTARVAYGQVRDIYNPRAKDYRSLQEFLIKGKRPALKQLGDMESRMRHFRLIGKTDQELPQWGSIAVNCSPEDRQNCVITYASYNKSFPKGLQILVDHLTKSDFKGHVLYRIGGWPNLEEGDLALAHVPYAFKVCFFREARRLGYERVLWLDSSISPLVSLNTIFDKISEKGYFTASNGQFVGPFMNNEAAGYFKTSIEECMKIPSCSAAIFGIDYSNPTAAEIISKWYAAAKDSSAFFSERPDQNALSIILYQSGKHDMAPTHAVVEAGEIPADALFKMNRGLVYN